MHLSLNLVPEVLKVNRRNRLPAAARFSMSASSSQTNAKDTSSRAENSPNLPSNRDRVCAPRWEGFEDNDREEEEELEDNEKDRLNHAMRVREGGH